jgi:hypothetical protein
MHDNKLFPLDAVPLRVSNAILQEFGGRCPSIREVEEIRDKRWLATPGVGPTALQLIRQVTDRQERKTESPSSAEMADTELLDRLEFIKGELRAIRGLLKAELARNSPRPARIEPSRSIPATS